MNTAYLLLGGNIGDRIFYLNKAQALIEAYCGKIVQQSSLYETAAWGIEKQPAFYNKVFELQTNLSPEALMQQLLFIEEELGRKRMEKYGPRIIDIDILLMDDRIINEADLIIPHPRLTERRFALAPLAEIAGKVIHPVYKKTIDELLLDCTDQLDVKKITSFPQNEL